MKLDFTDDKSIYLQIAESIENDILRGSIAEEQQLPSTNEMAILFKINPATANKGVGLLVDEGIVYKKRGIGMFVAEGAKEEIQKKRRHSFYERYIAALLNEAQSIGISRSDIVKMIENGGADHA